MICVFFYKRPIYADVVYSGFVALPDLGLLPYYVLQCNKDNYCKNNDFCLNKCNMWMWFCTLFIPIELKSPLHCRGLVLKPEY